MPHKHPFTVTKTFGHDLGLSACFRQHGAAGTHCKFLHGYAIAVALEIGATHLDHRNWVYSFGDFAEVKTLLRDTLDHKTLVATDDPELSLLVKLNEAGVIDMVILKRVGCEALAEYLFDRIRRVILEKTEGRAVLTAVTISEHGANSVTYRPL